MRFFRKLRNVEKINTVSNGDGTGELRRKDLETISKFPQYVNSCKSGNPRGFFGIQELPHYVPGIEPSAPSIDPRNEDIPFDEEYFEWMDILESIVDSGQTFQFVEVGAGYGRWAARAFRAAQLFGVPTNNIHICTVEADPLHSKWLKEHMSLNEIPEENLRHFECAVSNFDGKQDFFVRRPNQDSNEQEAKNWYGQALKHSGWQGATSIEVDVRRLSRILEELPTSQIDLIDFDIQGEEPTVLREIENQLFRVKKIHIGTNSREDEKFFRQFFKNQGWTCKRDYEGLGTRNTYVGAINFVDGVQTYINPQR